MFLVIEVLYQGSLDPPGHQNGPIDGTCELIAGTLAKKGQLESFNGQSGIFFLNRPLEKDNHIYPHSSD